MNVCLWLHCLRIQPQDLRAFNNQWVVCHDFYSIFVYLTEAIKNVTRLTFTQEIKKIVCMWLLLLVRDRSWNSIGSTIAFILERCKFPYSFSTLFFWVLRVLRLGWPTPHPPVSWVIGCLPCVPKNRLGWPLNNGNGLYNRKRVYAYRFQCVKMTKITGNEQIVHNSPTSSLK